MKSLFATLLVVAAACGEVGSTNSTADDPKIASISPDHGPLTGGITVTLTGEGFGGSSTVVVVDGVLATDAMATSDTQLTFTLPPGEEGSIADVTVGTDHGFATLPEGFKYNLRPIILSVEPQMGRGQGGTQITLKGRGFQSLEAGVPMIKIGGGLATNVQIIDDQTITAITGAVVDTKPFIKTDVELVNANGTATLPESFTTTAKGLLGLQRASRVFFVDRQTGEMTPLANVGHHLVTCASVGSVVYGVGRSATDSLAELVTFDPLTGTATVIGPVGSGPTRYGITAMAAVGDKLIGANVSQGTGNMVTNRLVEIDKATGNAVVLGGAPMPVGRPVGIAARDGSTLYIADNTAQTFDTVAIASSTVATGPAITGGTGSRVHGLVNMDGVLYLLERDTNRLFSITPTGVMTLITNLTQNLAGLCETPSSF